MCSSDLGAFLDALIARAAEHAGSVMPGFTHLQSAQPVTLGHHLMAYHEMIVRDRSRFRDARARLGRLAQALSNGPWDTHALEERARAFAESEGMKLGDIAQPLRAALTGRAASPPIFEVMSVLGAQEALTRIRAHVD